VSTSKRTLDALKKGREAIADVARLRASLAEAEAKVKGRDALLSAQTIDLAGQRRHGSEMFDKACWQMERADAAEARADRLAEIVEALPCKCGSYELPEHNALCPKSKAAAAKETR
jgi:multidrug efflux pump subunit AcrA (membrane-fusion protein)